MQPQRAREGSDLCGVHACTRKRDLVTSSDGGWCVWCGEAAKRFEIVGANETPLSLCMRHAKALARELAHVIK